MLQNYRENMFTVLYCIYQTKICVSVGLCSSSPCSSRVNCTSHIQKTTSTLFRWIGDMESIPWFFLYTFFSSSLVTPYVFCIPCFLNHFEGCPYTFVQLLVYCLVLARKTKSCLCICQGDWIVQGVCFLPNRLRFLELMLSFTQRKQICCCYSMQHSQNINNFKHNVGVSQVLISFLFCLLL